MLQGVIMASSVMDMKLVFLGSYILLQTVTNATVSDLALLEEMLLLELAKI